MLLRNLRPRRTSRSTSGQPTKARRAQTATSPIRHVVGEAIHRPRVPMPTPRTSTTTMRWATSCSASTRAMGNRARSTGSRPLTWASTSFRCALVSTDSGLRHARSLRLVRIILTIPKIWRTSAAPVMLRPVTTCQVGTSPSGCVRTPNTRKRTRVNAMPSSATARTTKTLNRRRRSRWFADSVGAWASSDSASAQRASSSVASGCTSFSIATIQHPRGSGACVVPPVE
jgi:hypothetical protein